MSTTTERIATEPSFEELATRVDDAVAALAGLDASAREWPKNSSRRSKRSTAPDW